MTIWRVEGKWPLRGGLRVQGSKNAMLPILAASLLVPGETELLNCPELRDLSVALEILQYLGCSTAVTGDTVTIDASCVSGCALTPALSGAMRASVTFLGPLLARCGEAEMTFPGGCALGRRPVNLHLYALRCLGAEVQETERGVRCTARRLRGGTIDFPISSVGATENAILAACGAAGETVIRGAAREPEIIDLQRFLCRAGFRVTGAGTSVITVLGGRGKSRVGHRIMSDRIVAATYLCAGAITGGEVELRGLRPEDQGPVLRVLEDMGCTLRRGNDFLRLQGPALLRSPGEIVARPFPGFPTDVLPLMMALSCTAKGTTVFHDLVFENRYRHAGGLTAMGAEILVDGRRAVVRGRQLHGAEAYATDLRGGAALVLAGLAAEGETRVWDEGHLSRGYTGLDSQLCALGAAVSREEGVCPTGR